jgi:hypothetical protein
MEYSIGTTLTSPHPWTIPATASGSNYRIKIIDEGDLSEDLSVADFRITQPVVLTSPNGGQIYATGSTHNITWTDGTGNATIELWDYSGAPAMEYSIGTTLTSPYSWTIPATASGSNYRIKIIDEGDLSEDLSVADFRITQPVVLTSPNGGEIWATGSTRTISWTEGSGTSTTIELWDNTTGLKITDITSGVVGYSYSWVIGATANGSNYRIKLIDVGDGSIDQSNANFRLTQPIVVSAPNGGEIWATGSTRTISWTEGSGTNAKIELWNNSTGLKVYDITTGVVGYTFSWVIGATANGINYRIKIIDLGDASVDFSNADFRITQPVVVTSPNGGEAWATGSTHNITWSEGSGTSTIELWYNGLYLDQLATGYAGHSYPWTISGIYAVGTLYKIKIFDEGDASTDFSNNNFAITQYVHVTMPTVPGIRWNLGSTYNITWNDNVPGPVIVELYYNGVFHSVLAPSIPDGTTSFSWTIPVNHLMGNYFKVKISSIADPTIVDMSDHFFRIDAATNTYNIAVIQPSLASIRWVAGESYLVSWTDNLASPVKVELVNFGVTPATITTVSASVVGSTVAWTIPGGTPSGSQYKIMVTSTTENGVIDLSDNYFEITSTPPQGNIIVEQPSLDGITWLRGSSYLISWTDNIPNNNVTIELLNGLTDGLVATIATNVPGSTYVWDIPLLTYPVGVYKIKVIYNGISDKSDFNFAISDSPFGAYIHLLQPNVNGITWLEGHDYLISWEDNIPGTVDIYYTRTSVPALIPIASDISGSTYVWNVPDVVDASDYFVKIFSHADAGISGISANDFDIRNYLPGGTIEVLLPNGGETWTKGSSYYISWDNNFDENVKIELVNYSTGITRTIEASVPGSTVVWTIPNTSDYPGGIQYSMKISSVENPGLFDESDAYFTIVDPASLVIYPNPADNYLTVQFNEQAAEDYTIIITDRFNMQVMERTFNSSGMDEIQISTALLSNGVYFLNIISGNSVTTKKVIVQH